jgi:predicted dehydrogenase
MMYGEEGECNGRNPSGFHSMPPHPSLSQGERVKKRIARFILLEKSMLSFALVGCGGMANWHAQQLKAIPEVKVVALCDTVGKNVKVFQEKYFAEAEGFESYEGMLEKLKGKLDAVVLVTPHTLHYPQAKKALEAGVNVLCEKPMVTSSEHAYDLWKTVKSSGKMMGITYQSPYTAEFGYLAEQRDAGKWGKVQVISGWLSQWWLELTRSSWRQEPAMSGGGQMYDSGAHLLNAMMWLMNDPVVEVGCFYDRVGSKVDINGVAIVRFQNGALGSIAIGGNSPPFKTEIQIQTDKMVIETDQYGGKLEMKGLNGKKIYPAVKLDERPSAGTPHLNFVQALMGKEKLRAPVRYGVLLSALMDAMYESADTHSIVKVKPVPNEI